MGIAEKLCDELTRFLAERQEAIEKAISTLTAMSGSSYVFIDPRTSREVIVEALISSPRQQQVKSL